MIWQVKSIFFDRKNPANRFEMQCLRSQTFFNSCPKNRLDFLAKVEGEADGTKGGGLFSTRVIAWLYNWGMLVSGVAGRPPKNICLRSISNFSVSGCAGYWNWRSHLSQIFFGVRPATSDTLYQKFELKTGKYEKKVSIIPLRLAKLRKHFRKKPFTSKNSANVPNQTSLVHMLFHIFVCTQFVKKL